MPTTQTLQNSINFAASILKNQPQQVNNQDPAVTVANIVLGTMLGPPMRWRQNRSNTSIALSSAGRTDYTVSLPTFSFLDTQWLEDTEGTLLQLNGAESLPKTSTPGQPLEISPQYDDNAGNVTFRVKPMPNGNYTAHIDYQEKMQLLQGAGDGWAPISDEFLYIFNEGFLALMMLLVNDARFPIFEGYFTAHLLGAQGGLTEQQRDIFMQSWMRKVNSLAASQGMTNYGLAGRTK